MREPLSSSPRTCIGTDTFGYISGMDDDNTDDDVNWEVTSKSFARQAATGRSEITVEPTRLDFKLWTRIRSTSPIELIHINWKSYYCNCYHWPCSDVSSLFHSCILFFHSLLSQIWLTQHCDSVSTPWIFKWLTVIGAWPHMLPFSQLPWLPFKQQQLLQRLYLEMKKAEKTTTIQKR